MIKFNCNSLDWDKGEGLIPVIVQDRQTGQVLMLGYMNQAALEKTLATGKVTFYSRTKQRLWVKGETSGNSLQLVNLQADCDQDTLLIQAIPAGPVCHLGYETCFKHEEMSDWGFIRSLEALIEQRQQQRSQSSYISQLLESGTPKIAQKVGEEGVEVALASVTQDKQALAGEAADLLFHLLVLLKVKQLSFKDVIAVLKQRRQKKDKG